MTLPGTPALRLDGPRGQALDTEPDDFDAAMAVHLPICPTLIRTPLTERTFANSGRRKKLEEMIKPGGAREVEDLMGAAIYLSLGAALLVNGTAPMIAGGWIAE